MSAAAHAATHATAHAAAQRMNRIAARLAALALLLAALGAANWAARQPCFDLRRIDVQVVGAAGGSGQLGEVDHAPHVSPQSLRAAVAGRLAGNFFTLSLDEARRVFETVPWVAEASVRRIWPDRLAVTLVEYRPVGVWSDGRLLSDGGVLFDANPAEAEASARAPLVAFAGPARHAGAAASHWREFDRLLAQCGLAVAAIEVSDRAAWSVQASNGLRLELGRDEPPGALRARLAGVVALYPTLLEHLHGAAARIDARYPNGLAVAAAAS